MGELFFVLLALSVPIFIFVSCIAVWVRTNNLQEEINNLRRQLREVAEQVNGLSRSALEGGTVRTTRPAAATTPKPAPAAEGLRPIELVEDLSPGLAPLEPKPYSTPDAVRAAYEVEKLRLTEEEEQRREAAASARAEAAESVDVPQQKAPSNFEFQFGKRLPVWIGGVALALAGFYLVKYSIEQGWLTEQVRVILGYLLGAGFIAGANHIHKNKPDMADGARIAQALAGSGIAVLYAATYAATMMYGLIPQLAGFVVMAGVTALAVVLSVRHGMPIAVLGMLGGFLTPALIRTGHDSAPMLFSYLFLLVVGMFAFFRQRGWWVLAIPVVLLSGAWVLLWMFTGRFTHVDGFWLCAFILGVAAVVLVPAARMDERKMDLTPRDKQTINTLHLLVGGGALALMSLVVVRAEYSLLEWGFFAILALGGIAMAYFRPSEFRNMPMATLIVNLFMIAFWRHAVDAEYAWVQLGFAAVYALPALYFLRIQPTLNWAGLITASALGFYGVGYMTMRTGIYGLLNINAPLNYGNVAEPLHFWSALATALALGFAALTAAVFQKFHGEENLRDRLLALFCLTTTAFISVALTIEVHRDFLPVAFAGELLAVCWVYSRIDIKSLRQIAGILFAVFIFLISPQLAILASVTLNSLLGVQWNPWGGLPPLAAQPVFQLGIPMIMLGASSWFLRLRGDGKLVELFEVAMVGLGALMLYYLARHAFKVPSDVMFRSAGFMERGVITNIFFAASLAVVWAGRNWSRRALVWSGTALFAAAFFRVFYFDFIICNPLWNSSQNVGAGPLFNWLILPYALPVLWLWLEERPNMRLMTVPPVLCGAITLLLGFTFISFNVRQMFHGGVLAMGATPNAEIYTYSAVWLVLGAGLLFLGTLKKDKSLRVASLGLMILTVGKVFLYDIDALSGLYRVFSFLGLGFSLLALSWFYSRFVFKKDE